MRALLRASSVGEQRRLERQAALVRKRRLQTPVLLSKEARKQLLWARMAQSAHLFIFGDDDLPGLLTKDEHAPEEPVQPFPDKPYLRVFLDCLLVSGRYLAPQAAHYALDWGVPLARLTRLHQSGVLCIEKSRQVMASWMVVAYLLWRAKFHPHQLILVQSKREDDAALLVFTKEPQIGRMSFLELGVHDDLRQLGFGGVKEATQTGIGATRCHLFFPNGSHVWGIPQGGNIIRSNTCSCLFSDEAAFQPEFGLAYQAALPSIKGGGQGIFVSSAEVGDFAVLIEAEL
jgi:hypothetical protein